MSSLVVGSKLYIDETVVSLQSKNGYVWCITDGTSVYYFYRESREAAFLLDMLRDFNGVLISDFYTGYDAVPCPQQRCLIHLMRDFNEEMQKSPFDYELQMLSQRFSSVLRAIVATIDKLGYKKKHLRKHKKSASDFCEWASCRQFLSVAAERLRNKVEKYQDKMFTFLDYDGVCWNNTNAEHAIKGLPATAERQTRFTERSIQEYLAVLSIAETCKGRGEDFLEFLLKNEGCPISFQPKQAPPQRSAARARLLSPQSGKRTTGRSVACLFDRG